MKKIITYFILYIIFCILQFFFSQYFNIYRIFPNLILIFIVYLGLVNGVIPAEVMGFLFGLTWDVFSIDIFGMRTVMLTIVGYFVGTISKSFDKDRLSAQIVVVLLANLIYWLGFSLICWIIPVGESSHPVFIVFQTVFKMLATVLFAPVIFFILNSLRFFARADT
jgi:rod shape-determining protein MreD